MTCVHMQCWQAKIRDIKLVSLTRGHGQGRPQLGASSVVAQMQLLPDPGRADHPIMVANDLLKQVLSLILGGLKRRHSGDVAQLNMHVFTRQAGRQAHNQLDTARISCH